jgi:hypothetical protein
MSSAVHGRLVSISQPTSQPTRREATPPKCGRDVVKSGRKTWSVGPQKASRKEGLSRTASAFPAANLDALVVYDLGG